MNYKDWWKQISFGLISWVAPFVSAFFFVNQDGTYRIDEMLFKSLMVVISSLVGIVLSYFYFKVINRNFVREGVSIGLVWIVINWVLDAVLVMSGFFQMSMGEYVNSIGVRYLSIPVYTIGIGFMLQNLSKRMAQAE
jgi:hypothetical protein